MTHRIGYLWTVACKVFVISTELLWIVFLKIQSEATDSTINLHWFITFMTVDKIS